MRFNGYGGKGVAKKLGSAVVGAVIDDDDFGGRLTDNLRKRAREELFPIPRWNDYGNARLERRGSGVVNRGRGTGLQRGRDRAS